MLHCTDFFHGEVNTDLSNYYYGELWKYVYIYFVGAIS